IPGRSQRLGHARRSPCGDREVVRLLTAADPARRIGRGLAASIAAALLTDFDSFGPEDEGAGYNFRGRGTRTNAAVRRYVRSIYALEPRALGCPHTTRSHVWCRHGGWRVIVDE